VATNTPAVQTEQPRVGEVTANGEPAADPTIENLREILLSSDRRRIADLAARLFDVERRTSDEDALIAMIAPLMGDIVRRKVRDARDDMVEALYPILGQMVVRAVGEATRDLARGIDAQLRGAAGPRAIARRLRARVSGVSSAEMLLRDALPYEVAEIFLIHRATGLLLWHLSRESDEPANSELIGAMLTAIRDFAQDAFGRGQTGQLDEIQYGGRRILIEAAQHAYLAVVVDGIEPAGYRAEMREQIITIENRHVAQLREYQGDSSALADVAPPLRKLLANAPKPPEFGPVHKAIVFGALGLVLLCGLVSSLFGYLLWRVVQPPPAPAPIVLVMAAPTATPLPTATATPLPTATATPLPTATATPAPIRAVMTGDVFLHVGPSEESARLGSVIQRGQPVQILAVYGTWYRVRWVLPGQVEVIGWTPAEWVAAGQDIPNAIVTPTAAP
jgi:hypothetical protein